ncbi:efflux RND transporter permease subunit [Aquincola sp. S2]|uniref:Efflux RND transporter permease subunit n=2 Tax=Pseudaquabacterium terrae TaxID=2732868 RepID=A0ABX2EEJ7_9BURK|nr:efflux RND transporter permease subunit [Aquabacterium terrae]
MQNISAKSIRQPIPSIILFILLTLAGLLGFHKLGINQYPDIDIPVVTVTVNDPGAAPAELETQVARIVENAVATVGDVAHIRSTVSDGSSATSVEFHFGKDVDRAVSDVRDAVTRIRGDLPGSVNEPVITRMTTSGGPMMTYVVKGAAGQLKMAPDQLSWFVDNEVAKRLLTVPGVGQVKRVGGIDREVRIVLDPQRLNAHGITAAEVSKQLRATNINLPGGKATVGGHEQSIRTLGGAQSIEALRALQIGLRDGRTLRLGDLGTVIDDAAEATQDAFVDGQRVVAFQVIRGIGSSSVDVARAVEKAVQQIDQAHANVDVTLFNSTVEFTKESYYASIEALILGALLAVVVVFWFLRDWRATLISAIAMPLSVIPTFIVMSWLGFSLNLITLLGLSLVVGILVDDAIVEVENIVRHMRMGKSAYQAAIDAADEIGLAVVATTLAIVAVFVPVSFMSGVPGQFFRQFGISVAVAVVFSLLVARLLTPVMGAYWLKPHGTTQTEDGPVMRRYLALVRWGLKHRKLAMLSGVGLFAGSMALAPLLPSGFIPNSDRSVSTINFELPPGTRLADTAAAAEAARQLLARHPEVKAVLATVGTGAALDGMGTAGNAESRAGTMTVSLVPPSKRDVTQREFEKQVERELRSIPGLRFRFGGGEAGETLEVILVGDNPRSLEQAAENVEREMRGVPGVGNPAAASSLKRPELVVRPDLARAADLGVTVSDLATTVRVATIGDSATQLPKFHLDERSLPIRAQLALPARDDLDTLRLLRVPTADGKSVTLDTVATLEMASGSAQITRFDRQRSVSIRADVGGAPLGEVNEAIAKLPSVRQLPSDVRQVEYGDSERMTQLFEDFGIAMIAGVLLVYCVLVLLFHDFAQPVTIMAALPLSIGGALGLLLLAGEAMSLPATIGILMLMGIVTKNSILLVEYALVALKNGASRREAMLDACSKRAQPILMTTVAMGAGMLPIALKIGADADFRAPMAIAVIGGLITSTVLSLFYVPVVFSYVDDAKRWVLQRFERPVAPGQDAQPVSVE